MRRPLPPTRRADRAAHGPDATIVERDEVGSSIVRLRVRPDAGVPPFEPGQYLALGIEADAAQGALLQRPYSTASPRGESDALEFLVRLVPTGALTPRLWRLGPGARLRLGRPKGRFVPDRDDPRRPLLIATGTGIAPLVSILETRLRETPDAPARRRPIVVHGVARAADLAWRDRLEDLAKAGRITYVPAVSRPSDPANAAWAGATGRLGTLLPAVLEAARVDPGATVAFVCGNPAMTDAARAMLGLWGMRGDAVRSEDYWPGSSAGVVVLD